MLGGISVGIVGEWCVEGGWGWDGVGFAWWFMCAYVYEYQ